MTNAVGKLLIVNDDDTDGDGIPDYADGFDLLAGGGTATNDEGCAGERFVPVVVSIPEPVDIDQAWLQVEYAASDPGRVTTNASGAYLLPGGNLRLWSKDGAQVRNTNAIWSATPGDYLPPTPSGGTNAAALGFSNSRRQLTFYVEGVRPSAEMADQRIVFRVDPNGNLSHPPGFIAVDAVRVTVLKVEKETVATTPADRTRKTVGVGEEVYLRIVPSAISGTWSTTGGSVNPTNGNATLLEVPHAATSITVTVACGSGFSCAMPFSVLSPSGYVAPMNTPITGYGANVAGAGMKIDLWLPPTNVSFYRVEIIEVGAVSTNATGYFANTNVWPAWALDHGLCGAGSWVPVGMDNHIGTDTANSGTCPAPWADGHFSWPIPGGWRVAGDAPTNALPWSDQDFTIGNNGTVTVLKFGHGVTRATNNVYTVVY